MRLLLDECIPRKLKNSFPQFECSTVPEAGFAGKKNGVLLTLAEGAGFHVLLTMDEGLEYEQTLEGRKIAIIIVRAKSNRLADLLQLVPDCIVALTSVRPGQLVRIGS